MQGFIPVDIPTKTYIKAYVISKLGPLPRMTTDSDTIGNKLYDLLQHKTNERAQRYDNAMYKAVLRIYIPINTFKKRGGNLNENNLKNFNLFIEREVKLRFHTLMDDAMEHLPSFENNLPHVRRKLGIDIEAWSDDSMKKDYYRKRKRSGTKLLYNKTFSPSVPQKFLA
ncbi:MAG: hypothetical protein V4594_16840 [Bacteroidota bacterium]